MPPTFSPADATLGAIVTDIDLSALDDDAWSRVEDAFHEYGVLIFPGQNLDEGGADRLRRTLRRARNCCAPTPTTRRFR